MHGIYVKKKIGLSTCFLLVTLIGAGCTSTQVRVIPSLPAPVISSGSFVKVFPPRVYVPAAIAKPTRAASGGFLLGPISNDWYPPFESNRWTSIVIHHSADESGNDHGIGICLVGNFENHPATARQKVMLRKLVTFLMQRYDIPPSKVYGHGELAATKCPGKYLGMGRFRRVLDTAGSVWVSSTR